MGNSLRASAFYAILQSQVSSPSSKRGEGKTKCEIKISSSFLHGFLHALYRGVGEVLLNREMKPTFAALQEYRLHEVIQHRMHALSLI